jgi:hypothetical protein
MNEHVTATLNGQSLLSLRIELRRGGSPSSFEAVLPPSAIAQPGPVVLNIADAETQRTFSQFVARHIEALGDGRVRVLGSDLRESWRRPVQCEMNVPVGDGTAWREGEPLSAQVAVERMFEAAGLAAAEAPRLPGGTPAPVNLRGTGELAGAVETLLASVGLSCTVDDDGQVVFASADTTAALDETRLIEISASQAQRPSVVAVVGGPALELAELADFEPVLPDDSGALQPLTEVLTQWGISEHAARQACLSDGGFEQLLPATSANGATRLAALKRCAFRLFRARGAELPWLPVGGLNDDGTFQPPALTARIARPIGTAPKHPAQRSIEETTTEPIEGFELDADAGLVYQPRPPFALAQPSGGADDPTLQDRRLSGDAKLSLRVAHRAARPPFTFEFPGGGEGEPVSLHAPHLVALYENGQVTNLTALRAAASELAAAQLYAHSRRVAKLAGVADTLAVGSVERVVIEAGGSGLVSTISERTAQATVTPTAEVPKLARSHPSAPVPSGLHQPINAFRAGPLVLRASGETPEGESVLAVEALHRRDDTGALELRHPGPLAFPFFLESTDVAKFGRWFFVAGVEVADSGRLRVLAPDARHAEIAPSQLFEARHAMPQAMRGLIVSLGNEPQYVDCGPLVSDSRGRDPGASSSLVYDLDGSSLGRRGGLQFLSVLALSPAHRQEGARDGGWAPALNLREGDTANPEVLGRGLFAERDGRSLGRLTATLQGGPLLADAAHCSKHLYGTAVDDGVYRESAGHISTDAFFKVPGDAVHDAPVKFYAEPFEGGIPHWPPYEAQLKYDAAERHPWNHARREGRWKIQYRVPFLPEIPPTWKPPIGPPPAPPVEDPPPSVPAMLCVPHDIRPAVSEYELWAPSHDWVPAPSDRGQEREVPYPGPSIKSQGWAGEANGVPDPSMGGGCIYLPPGVSMPDAQLDAGTRRTFLALHPEVVLAFGHPKFTGGRVHSGWALQLATFGGHLELLPRDVDASTPAGLSRGVHVTGHLQLGPVDAGFGDTHALRLGAGDDEGIAFGDDVQLYRDGPATLRTDGNLEVGGKLGVAGLIDPTGLELTPQTVNPGGVAANTAWIKSSDARLYHGANKLAYSSELPSLPVSLADGGTGASGADGAINELISNATLNTAPGASDEIAVRSGTNGRRSQLQHLLAAVGGLSQLTSVTDGHKFLVIDDAGAAKYAKFEDLHPSGANLVSNVIAYTGSGSSGKTVTLTGINRAYAIIIQRYQPDSTHQWDVSLPGGSTGTVYRRATNGYGGSEYSLSAPSAGSNQVLTINDTGSDHNANGVAYRLLVIGTPT